MKNALIIVDLLDDFLKKVKEASTLKARILNELSVFEGEHIFVLDQHGSDYPKLAEASVYQPHCMKFSFPHEFLSYFKTSKIIYKNTFASLELLEYLKEKNFKSLKFGGLFSEICVLHNALLARSALPYSKICVDFTLCATPNTGLNHSVKTLLKLSAIDIKE